MTWIWTALVAAAVAGLASRFLPRVALEVTTKLIGTVPRAAILGAGVGLITSELLEAAALAVIAGLAGVLFVVDLKEHRLPDTVILTGLIAWAIGIVAMAATTGGWGALLRALLAALAMFAGFFVAALLANGMLGFGDVKLSALLGAVLGWYSWMAVGRGLFFGIVLHGLFAVVVLIVTRDRKADVPMGPALIAGAAVAIAISA
ncbi:prepilin peptidase [Tessaracoccus sp. Y36]